MIVIVRTFTDNNHYSDKWAYLDELVSSLDCLYDNSSSCYLPFSSLSMPDFMSCVDCFMCAASSKQAKITIRDYIFNFGICNDGHSRMEHEYCVIDGRKMMKCAWFEDSVIEAIVWTAYIYFLYRSEISDDDKWTRGTKVLYECLFERSGFRSEEAFLASNWLMQKKQETIKKFAESVQETMNSQKDINNANVSTKDKEQKQDDKIEFIFGQGKRTKTKRITSKEIADIAMEYDFAKGMTKSDMQDMLSRITGISSSSFQNYLKTNS